jgi:hypothetical protein
MGASEMTGDWIAVIVAGIAFAAVLLGRVVFLTRARQVARRRSENDDLRSRGT